LHDLQEHHQQDDPTVVNQPDPTSNHARSQEEPIIPPNQDQEFETLEAAQESAERYARSVNTVVIVKRTTKDKNGNIVQVRTKLDGSPRSFSLLMSISERSVTDIIWIFCSQTLIERSSL